MFLMSIVVRSVSLFLLTLLPAVLYVPVLLLGPTDAPGVPTRPPEPLCQPPVPLPLPHLLPLLPLHPGLPGGSQTSQGLVDLPPPLLRPHY